MFFDMSYDTHFGSIYVFTCIMILKLKYFTANNALFYNMSVCDIGETHIEIL